MIDNLQMNFVSTAMMCKAVIPGMKERGFGRIINMVRDPQPHPLVSRAALSSSCLKGHDRLG